jgi:hypothetical protein
MSKTPGEPLPEDHVKDLRVAYRSEGNMRENDKEHTRLVIQVDLEDQESLQVDLTIVEQK